MLGARRASELVQETHVVPIELADVGDSMASHTKTLDSQSKGEAGDFFRVISHRLQNRRIDHPRTAEFDPVVVPTEVGLDTRLGMYEMLQTIRQVEKRAYDLFLQNLVKGTSHLSLGMEAIAAGVGANLRPDDYTFATYRGHAHTLAKGGSR